MADLIFKISPDIILGSYTLTRLGQYAKNLGSKFMIIMDPILKDFNLSEKITQPLTDRKIDFFIYDNFNDGATTKDIENAVILAKQSHIHGIIAAGGEKAINAGCAVAALYNENRSIYDYIDNPGTTADSIPLICIPGTCRAPYAFTNSIPVTDSRSRQVRQLKIKDNACSLMLWDPNLSLTLTENQNTSLSLETLCLACEAYFSQKASFFSDMFCEKSFELLSYGMDEKKSLDITTPQEILLAQGGCMASLSVSTSSPGIASLLALAINARFKINRSLAATILFPYVIEEVAKFKADKIEKIARLYGTADEKLSRDEAVQSFTENIRQKIAKANLPVRLKELNLTMEQLATCAEDAGQLDIMTMLPRSMTTDELFELMKQAY